MYPTYQSLNLQQTFMTNFEGISFDDENTKYQKYCQISCHCHFKSEYCKAVPGGARPVSLAVLVPPLFVVKPLHNSLFIFLFFNRNVLEILQNENLTQPNI